MRKLWQSLSFSILKVHFPPSSASSYYTFTCPPTPKYDYLASALQECINSNSPSRGLALHAHIVKVGHKLITNIAIKLLILHLKCRGLEYARQVFEEMSKPTLSAYNYLMDGYVKHNRFMDLFELVRRMSVSNVRPDGFTFALILKAWICRLSTLSPGNDFGREVHALALKSHLEEDIILFSTLVDAYVKCRRVDYAGKLFNLMSVENIMCSTSIISGYMNESRVEEAERIFKCLSNKDVVVFNAMIEGYSKNIETAEKSVKIYIGMRRSNIRPTISTFASLIGACSVLTSVEIGQQVQSQLMKSEYFINIKIASALIDMYSKCGVVEDAYKIFDHMPEKNVFSWTSMIDGFGKNGNPKEALVLFDNMQNEHQVTPNHITFLSTLSACAHNGLLGKGQEIFESMQSDFSLKPGMEHYACMVDMLGRFGSIDRAWEFVKRMPAKPNSDVWAALLSCCRLHGEVEIANIAANELFKLGVDTRPGSYISLSNTLADAGRWDGVSKVRELMKTRRVEKDTGFSWVGTDGSLKYLKGCKSM